mmetsp:Transcript_24238/g.37792  ORF Transcript_24238/g.37792 Transcript_24238/m.37792 type:complete len:132 (-) Transcript_24238:114-509(-)
MHRLPLRSKSNTPNVLCQAVRSLVHTFDSSTNDLMKLSEHSTIVANFSAKWCGPCKNIAPQYGFMSDYYPTARFYNIDVDDNPSTTKEFDIKAVPTFFILKNGIIEKRVDGPSLVCVKDALDVTVGPPKET